MRSRRAFAVLLSIVASLTCAAGDDLESSIKAAFLPKFAPFVQWPTGAFSAATSALVLCAQGTDPVVPLLERAVTGQAAWGRPIVVQRVDVITAQSGCHMAYVAGSSAQPVRQALSALAGAPVLTVTDGGTNPHDVGMINFLREGQRVRFDIDEQAASECGLVISSKLLSLARSVRKRR